MTLERALEAILFVADEPQTLAQLAASVSRPVAEVREAIEYLRADYEGERGGVRRSVELHEVAGGWRFSVRAEHDPTIAHLSSGQSPTKLSQAALETLSVIAYRQPIARSAVASIRAVNVDSVIRTLLGHGLIEEVDTDPETGAMRYGTTKLLLTSLGINSLDELPPISPFLEDGREGFDHD